MSADMKAQQRLNFRLQHDNLLSSRVRDKVKTLIPRQRIRLMEEMCTHFAHAPENGGPIAVDYGSVQVQCAYRMRFPRPTELSIFRQLSEDSPNIEASQPGSLNRDDLYANWFDSGRNRRCFLLLEETLANGSEPLVVAGSIVLPITDSGCDILRLDGQSAASLRAKHICVADPPSDIVLDTWVMRRGYAGKCKHAFSLFLRHLSLFWDPRSSTKPRFWVEPDHHVLVRLAEAKFRKISQSAVRGHFTYFLDFKVLMSEAEQFSTLSEIDRKADERMVLAVRALAEKIPRMEGFRV
jgi:hypothetical protein